MIIPRLILFLVPLFFSHIFLPFVSYPIEIFGYVFGEDSSFERVKVQLFLFLILLGILEVFLKKRRELFAFLRKYCLTLISLILVPLLFFSSGFFLSFDLSFFLLGSHEKYHGYLFYLGIIFCFLLFSLEKNKQILIRTSLFASFIIATFSLLEFLGIWQFFPKEMIGSLSWEVGRTLSTLGNPNYVAGYLLIHLPLVFLSLRSFRISSAIFLFIAILTSGSFIGIFLGIFFLSHVFFFSVTKSIFQKKYQILIFSFFWILGMGMVFLSGKITEEKYLSFSSRGIIMSDIVSDFLQNPGRILTGNGPEGVLLHFATDERSTVINEYFPKDANIDSSHNIFLDILYQYGIIFFFGFFFILVKRWQTLPYFSRVSISLGFLFFSFNVIVIAPLLPIILILSYDSRSI